MGKTRWGIICESVAKNPRLSVVNKRSSVAISRGLFHKRGAGKIVYRHVLKLPVYGKLEPAAVAFGMAKCFGYKFGAVLPVVGGVVESHIKWQACRIGFLRRGYRFAKLRAIELREKNAEAFIVGGVAKGIERLAFYFLVGVKLAADGVVHKNGILLNAGNAAVAKRLVGLVHLAQHFAGNIGTKAGYHIAAFYLGRKDWKQAVVGLQAVELPLRIAIVQRLFIYRHIAAKKINTCNRHGRYPPFITHANTH